MSTLKSSAENLTLNADGSGNDIKFQSNAVEKASIDQDGNVVASGTISSTGDTTITSGDIVFATAGKGICLGVTSNTDANTLDDYEEGTFTAGLTPGSGSITINGSYNTMSYTKIGRLVYCAGYISISGESSAGGSLKLTGLPFTVRNNNDAKCSMSFWANGLASNEIIEWIGECVPNQTYCYLYRGASGTITDDCTSDVDSSFDMRFMFTYTTDS